MWSLVRDANIHKLGAVGTSTQESKRQKVKWPVPIEHALLPCSKCRSGATSAHGEAHTRRPQGGNHQPHLLA
jgi:hypothetical protein